MRKEIKNTKLCSIETGRTEYGENHDKKHRYRFNLDFIVFQQDGAYIAYCPALDISSSGQNFNEAMANFYEMFQLHIECCIEAGTLQQDLISHGWKLTSRGVEPPRLVRLTTKPEVKRIFNSATNFERIAAPASIPALA